MNKPLTGPLTASLLLLLLLVQCSSSDGPPIASFAASPTPLAANLVRMSEESRAGDLVAVKIEITGETTDSDIYGFVFDLVLGDVNIVTLVPGSTAPGDALDGTGCGGVSAQASQQADRVIVGVAKLGACPGNGITDGETRTIVELTFRTIRRGMSSVTFAGSSGQLPTAIDSGNAPIDTIEFDGESAFLIGT